MEEFKDVESIEIFHKGRKSRSKKFVIEVEMKNGVTVIDEFTEFEGIETQIENMIKLAKE